MSEHRPITYTTHHRVDWRDGDTTWVANFVSDASLAAFLKRMPKEDIIKVTSRRY